MAEKKPRIVYIVPELRNDADTHFFYLGDFVERLSARADVFLIVLRGSAPKGACGSCSRIRSLGRAGKIIRPFRLIIELVRARLSGYRIFYTHYSYTAAIVAASVARFSGGTSLYWNCGMPWLYGAQRGLRFALRASHILVTGTRGMADLYRDQYGIAENAVRVMPNWIDTERFAIPPMIDSNKTTITFVHRLSQRKGADLLPRIITLLLDDPPKGLSRGQMRFFIAGGGPLLSKLDVEFSDPKYGGQVEIRGAVPQRDVPDILAKTDLFIMPSREEGFPRVLLEAMAAGVPFVATDVGGVCEIIPPEQIPLLVRPSDAVAFADAVRGMFADTARRARFARAGKAYVARYETSEVVERLMEIIREIDC